MVCCSENSKIGEKALCSFDINQIPLFSNSSEVRCGSAYRLRQLDSDVSVRSGCLTASGDVVSGAQSGIQLIES